MDFDLSSLDKLTEAKTATRTSKFAPSARARPKRPVRGQAADGSAPEPRASDAQEPAAAPSADGKGEDLGAAPVAPPATEAAQAPVLASARHAAGRRGAAPSTSQAELPAPSSQLPAAAVWRQPVGYDIPGPSGPDPPSSPGKAATRRFMPRASSQKGKQPAQPPTEHEAGPSSLGLAQPPGSAAGAAAGVKDRTLVILREQREPDADGAAAGAPSKGRKGRSRKSAAAVAMDVSTMSLKSIIKCAYAKERARLEEEKRKKEEEEKLAQEAGAPQPVAAAAPIVASPAPSAAGLAPRVEVVDGQMRIVEQSLSVQAQPEATGRLITVEDNPKLNNLTYAKRMNNERWSVEDTELFYKALRLFGTDFTLIERMFPGRQRKALKNKLQREYRADYARVDAALSGGGPASEESYKEVVALLKQHTEDQENTGVLEGSGEEQQPDLAAALLGPSTDTTEAEEGDDGEAGVGEMLALPAPPTDSGEAGPTERAKTKAPQRRSKAQAQEKGPAGAAARGATETQGASQEAVAARSQAADEGGPASAPVRRKPVPRVLSRRKRPAASAPAAEDTLAEEGEAAAVDGDAAAEQTRPRLRRQRAAAVES